MDKPKVIKKLNQALERELTEVVKYMHQSFWVKGKGRRRLVNFFREQSRESMGHAIRLGEHIVGLGGNPVVRILEIYEPRKGSARRLLEQCVEDERAARDGYLKLLPLVQQDKTLKRLVAGLAREEGAHIAQIQKMARRS